MQDATLEPAQRDAAGRQLALCEGSDWFWWFGDYNPAEAVSQFDRLYRRQLVNLYHLLGLDAPPTLAQPISSPADGNSPKGGSRAGSGQVEHGGVMRRANAN